MASESAPRFCLELLPPDEEQTLPASNLVPSPLGSGPLGLALDKNVFWRNDRTLHVRFLAGSPLAQRQVKQYAQEWENYANIKFVFDQSLDAEIRVDFQQGKGSYSYLGSTNLRIPKDQHTMNFGWFDDETRDEEFS
ncbi:hypothetical protein BGZ57DRAFT_432537 [Hyaloscypha finlandica]|nr:hypothetical protein BGZ57DRAFT_432537 [Hyaloscypha finlandica]